MPHMTLDFSSRPDPEGWHWARCACGWKSGPYPDAETMVDELMDHAYAAGLAAAPPAVAVGQPTPAEEARS